MNNQWTLNDGSKIYLVTLEEYNNLPNGTKLICIDGKKVTKGKNFIDNDTRFGFIAYGFRKK